MVPRCDLMHLHGIMLPTEYCSCVPSAHTRYEDINITMNEVVQPEQKSDMNTET